MFGELRVSEQTQLKDKFWNFVFYKFIFVFGVINVQHMDEVGDVAVEAVGRSGSCIVVWWIWCRIGRCIGVALGRMLKTCGSKRKPEGVIG